MSNGNLSLGSLRVEARLRELANTQKRVLRGVASTRRSPGTCAHRQSRSPGNLRDPVVSMSEKIARGKRYPKLQARRWARDGVESWNRL